MSSLYKAAHSQVARSDSIKPMQVTEQHVRDRACKLFQCADLTHTGEASASRLRVVLRKSKWPKFIAYDIESLLRRVFPDGSDDTSTAEEEPFCAEFCDFYYECLQDDERSVKIPSGPSSLRKPNPFSNDGEMKQQLPSSRSSLPRVVGKRDRRLTDPSHDREDPMDRLAPLRSSADPAADAQAVRRISSDIGPGHRSSRRLPPLHHPRSMRWSADDLPDRKGLGSRSSISASRASTSSFRPRRHAGGDHRGRLARDKYGAKPSHVVAGSEYLNKLAGGPPVFSSKTVTALDMAQFLHIFVDMEVGPDGSVSRDNFMAHLRRKAPNLRSHAMRLYDKALQTSAKNVQSSAMHSSSISMKPGPKPPVEALDFRCLLQCIYPAAAKTDIDELVKMATRARVASEGILERTGGRKQPTAFKQSNPTEIFKLWNTSRTGRLTLDECFEGMDAWVLGGMHALSFDEIRHSLEELYRVDDGKERGGQLNYMRSGMADAEYVRSVTLAEFIAWVKTRTKNTASMYV